MTPDASGHIVGWHISNNALIYTGPFKIRALRFSNKLTIADRLVIRDIERREYRHRNIERLLKPWKWFR